MQICYQTSVVSFVPIAWLADANEFSQPNPVIVGAYDYRF